ncbi:MAG: hypothetical protein OXU64_12935 [Gemmatimonadota bacterium]|nr:hypothetical protein [Gemmatimonadota bacterium]
MSPALPVELPDLAGERDDGLEHGLDRGDQEFGYVPVGGAREARRPNI